MNTPRDLGILTTMTTTKTVPEDTLLALKLAIDLAERFSPTEAGTPLGDTSRRIVREARAALSGLESGSEAARADHLDATSRGFGR